MEEMTVNTSEIQKQLITERKELKDRIEDERRRVEQAQVINPDRADLAWASNQRQLARQSLERTQERLQQVEAALQRIEEGTYGKCLRCGKEIQPERLQAMPAVEYCIDCQQKLEQRRSPSSEI
jgi:DnaK suppressor protein